LLRVVLKDTGKHKICYNDYRLLDIGMPRISDQGSNIVLDNESTISTFLLLPQQFIKLARNEVSATMTD
jgi:hypothetical protein